MLSENRENYLMKICVIGVGVIGSAIVKSLLRGMSGIKIIATRRNVDELKELEKLGVIITCDNKKAASEADVVMLCVKPMDVKGVLEEVKKQIEGKLVVSVAAAVPLKFLKEITPKTRFVRAMPNIAVLVNEAFIAYCSGPDVTSTDKKIVGEIFSKMGKYIKVHEKYMNSITGLSGSGPAYLLVIIEALINAGLKVGLPKDLAFLSSAQTVIGTGKLLLETKKRLSELKDMVVTPGGTTIEGIYELESGGIRIAIMRTVEAATKKSEKITNDIISAARKT